MKNKMKKELIQYGVIAVVALVLYLTGWHTPVISLLQRGVLATGLLRPNTERVMEEAANDFPTPDLHVELIGADGQVTNLKQHSGQVLFINLWATWCPPCLAEMPNIDQLYRELAAEDIVFLMISTDEDYAKAISHVAKKKYEFPIYQIKDRWPQALHSNALPTTFVIDKQGRLVLAHRGMAKYNTRSFKKFLREL